MDVLFKHPLVFLTHMMHLFQYSLFLLNCLSMVDNYFISSNLFGLMPFSANLIGFDTDLINLDRKFSVCVVCLSSKETNTVGNQLRSMYEMNDRFDLQVKLISNLEGNLFDVIMISTIIEDDAELNHVSKNSLNVTLTSAR